MKPLFGLTVTELVELWPFALEFYRSMAGLVAARRRKGYGAFVTVKDALLDATERQRARAVDAPDGPSAEEQSAFDRASGGSG